EITAGIGRESRIYHTTVYTGRPSLDGWCSVCGRKCPLCCCKAIAYQTGERPNQTRIFENHIWHWLHLGGEVMSGYLISGIALLLAVIMVMFYRWRTICTVKRLDEMLKA